MLVVNKEVKLLPGSRASLRVTVSKEAVKESYEKMLRDYASKVKIDGFRPGKVPLDVVEKRYKSSIESQMLEHLVNQAFQEALEQTAQKPLRYQSPSIEGLESYKRGEDLTFTAVYDVFPQLEIKEYKDIQISVPKVCVSQEDVGRELEKLQDRYATLLEKSEESVCELEDVVLVDFCELNEDLQEIEGTRRQDFTFTLGKAENVYDFDTDIEGMKKGETKVFEKTVSVQNNNEKTSEPKTVRLQVTLKRIQKKELPALDDELAKDVNEKFSTLADLTEAIKEELQTQLRLHLREYSVNLILDSLIKKMPFDVPKSLVNWQLDRQWKYMLQQSGMNEKSFEEVLGKTQERIRESWKPSIMESLKRQIVLENLLDKDALDPSEEEIHQEYERRAKNHGVSVEDVKNYFDSHNLIERLKYDLRLEKIKTQLIETVDIQESGEQDFDTFMKIVF